MRFIPHGDFLPANDGAEMKKTARGLRRTMNLKTSTINCEKDKMISFYLYNLLMVKGAEYGNRTRLPGLGSPCTTDVLIPRIESDKRADCLGADTRTRTEDLRITNALLYQLSHIGNCGAKVRQFCGIPKCLARYFSKTFGAAGGFRVVRQEDTGWDVRG
jgi:hypothetical protein